MNVIGLTEDTEGSNQSWSAVPSAVPSAVSSEAAAGEKVAAEVLSAGEAMV